METKIKTLKGAGNFFSLFFSIFGVMMSLRKVPKNKRISKELCEKISLAVSGVNECAYCTWLHTRNALEQGIRDEEIKKLLSGDFGSLAENEATALVYAQHWADTDGVVSGGAREKVIDRFGEGGTAHIEAYIRVVYFGNLCSNTVKIYEDNKTGKGNHPVGFFTYLICLPIAARIRKGFME